MSADTRPPTDSNVVQLPPKAEVVRSGPRPDYDDRWTPEQRWARIKELYVQHDQLQRRCDRLWKRYQWALSLHNLHLAKEKAVLPQPGGAE